MRLFSLATALVAMVRAAESSVGSAMVQVRAGLGVARSLSDIMSLPKAVTPTSPSMISNVPAGTAPNVMWQNSPQLAAVAAAAAEAGAHAEAHHVLQARLNEALEEGQQAIAEDKQILKLPGTVGDSSHLPLAPAINQMLNLAAHPMRNVPMGNRASAAPVPPAHLNIPASVPPVPRSVASLASLKEDLPELLSTENHMHVQASATTKRVADALQGAVAAEQEAQSLEAKAVELRANASLIMQRGAAVAEQASADIAKKTAQTALQTMANIEREAESAEVNAAEWRARAKSASQQANAAMSNMYHALNMSNTK